MNRLKKDLGEHIFTERLAALQICRLAATGHQLYLTEKR